MLYATSLHNHAFASGGVATLAVARVIYAFGAPAAKVKEVRVGLAINVHSIGGGGIVQKDTEFRTQKTSLVLSSFAYKNCAKF